MGRIITDLGRPEEHPGWEPKSVVVKVNPINIRAHVVPPDRQPAPNTTEIDPVARALVVETIFKYPELVYNTDGSLNIEGLKQACHNFLSDPNSQDKLIKAGKMKRRK